MVPSTTALSCALYCWRTTTLPHNRSCWSGPHRARRLRSLRAKSPLWRGRPGGGCTTRRMAKLPRTSRSSMWTRSRSTPSIWRTSWSALGRASASLSWTSRLS